MKIFSSGSCDFVLFFPPASSFFSPSLSLSFSQGMVFVLSYRPSYFYTVDISGRHGRAEHGTLFCTLCLNAVLLFSMILSFL